MPVHDRISVFLLEWYRTGTGEIPATVSDLLLLMLFSNIKEFRITNTVIKKKNKSNSSLVSFGIVRYCPGTDRYIKGKNKFNISLVFSGTVRYA